jgi:DDE superfamily endonuclease
VGGEIFTSGASVALPPLADRWTREGRGWILPKVNVELFNEVLADFPREFKLGRDQHIILTVDRAGWHTSKDLNIPEGLHLEYLPAYSPELQPAERLWTLIDEPIANRTFETLEDLEEVLFQ